LISPVNPSLTKPQLLAVIVAINYLRERAEMSAATAQQTT
jgi:hypothetical protein